MPLGKRQRKPPPDYSSRRVQFRLLVAVGSLLFVLTMMFEARKAENWQWMWKWNEMRPAAVETEDFDTRLKPVESHDPIGTVYANKTIDAATMIQQASSVEQKDALHRLELDSWSKLLARLDRTERTALDRVLLSARDRDAEASGVDPAWKDTLDKIATDFVSHLNEANEAVMLSGDTLADQQKESLLIALRELEVGWTRELLPALQAPLEPRPWTQPDRDRLNQLQSLLDELALKGILDDSFWRPSERDAWFRWFEILKKTDPAQLRSESTGQVGFLQLFKQSDEYRGKLVTIRGTVRLAYRVQAPPNIHGISDYVVYWVRPVGGPNSPIVVYALETPEGFPAVKDKDLDRTTTPLNEEVAFTGFFFKRWAYPGQNGLQTAPLILARSPVWKSGLTNVQARRIPAWAVVSMAVVAALFITWLTFRAGRSSGDAGTSLRRADRDQLEALKKQPVLASPEETLRKLAASDREEDGK